MRNVFVGVYAGKTVDDKIWAVAPEYNLSYSKDRPGSPAEGGAVRFAWNEAGLYVRAEMEDSFIIQTETRDEQLHFLTGDVFELFIKPLNDSYYWEMYATPHGNKTTLFFPREREGMETENFLRDHSFRGLEVFAEKSSSHWKAQLFVPAAQLTAFGGEWGDGAEWTVFCGRYNYSGKALKNPELSMAPALSQTNYHLSEEYAILSCTR